MLRMMPAALEAIMVFEEAAKGWSGYLHPAHEIASELGAMPRISSSYYMMPKNVGFSDQIIVDQLINSLYRAVFHEGTKIMYAEALDVLAQLGYQIVLTSEAKKEQGVHIKLEKGWFFFRIKS
jgi:hypothetical protein